MKVSLDYDSQYMEQYKMFQTTNQIYIYIYVYHYGSFTIIYHKTKPPA